MLDSALPAKVMEGTKGISTAQGKVFHSPKLNINSEPKETIEKAPTILGRQVLRSVVASGKGTARALPRHPGQVTRSFGTPGPAHELVPRPPSSFMSKIPQFYHYVARDGPFCRFPRLREGGNASPGVGSTT